MKIGIDSYCFHRYFGEAYVGLQRPAGVSWSVWDFLNFAESLHVDSVSLETCFLPELDAAMLGALRARLDRAGLERVLAWGHPDGLDGGRRPEALHDLRRHIGIARDLGATAVRIVGGNASARSLGATLMIEALSPLLADACTSSEKYGVVLAIENHNDFTASEMVDLMEAVSSEHLGVTLDTGNALRVHDDPVAAAGLLAPYTVATHIKDIAVHRGSPRDFAFWRSCPVGQGIVDVRAVADELSRAGYEGALTVEIDLVHPRWEHLPEEALVRESVASLRQIVSDMHNAAPRP